MDASIQPTQIDTVLLKVASRCNINCTYCYVYNMGDDNWSRMSKFMAEDTIVAACNALHELAGYQDRPFSIVLHGGEPLLLGAIRLERLLSLLRSALPDTYPISIQTNGVLLSNEVLDICFAYGVTVAVSIDGPEHIHNTSRVDKAGRGTFAQVMAGIALLHAHPGRGFLNTGTLAVIDPASDAGEVYRFFKELDTPSVDFLYRDGNHDRLPDGKSTHDSTEYGRWMSELLAVYISDPDPLPIRILDDMMKSVLGGGVTKEGIGVSDFGILIIDTDGTIMKNDTLKSSYNGADKFGAGVNVKDGNLTGFINSADFLEYKKMQRPSHPKCLSCKQLAICGGGMTLHRWGNGNGFDNPSVYCSDQVLLIGYIGETIKKLVPHA